MTYAELGERVVNAYQGFPCRLTVPLTEGDVHRRVGRHDAAALPRTLVTRGPGESLRLNRGRFAGFGPGTVLDVFAEGVTRVTAVGRVEVIRAGLHDAECRIVSGELDVAHRASGAALHARVVSRPLGDYRLPVAVVDARGNALDRGAWPREVARYLEAVPERFPCVASPRDADWWLVVTGRRLFLRPVGGAGGWDRFGFGARELGTQLERVLRVRNLKRIAASPWTAGWGEDLDVWVERRTRGRGRPVRLRAGELMHPGDRIRVCLQKHADQVYDVAVFYLDAYDRITVLHPHRGRTPRLERGASDVFVLTDWVNVIDDALGLEHLLVFAIPREADSPVVDLSWLARELVATRGAPPADPFEALLHRIAIGQGLRGDDAIPTEAAESTRARLLTLATEWPALGPPAWPAGRTPSELERRDGATGGAAAEAGATSVEAPAPPDPWQIALDGATGAALTGTALARGRNDVLLLGGDVPRTVFLDFDGGVRRNTDVAQLVATRAFDAEAAFHFGAERWLAYYDTGDSGSFDLVLVDNDRDAVAESMWLHGDEGWDELINVAVPWLSQAHLDFLVAPRDQTAATTRLGILVRSD